MKPVDHWTFEREMRMGASTGARSTGVKERGNAYHRKVYKTLKVHAAVTMPGWKFYEEPWFRNRTRHTFRSPDAMLVHEASSTALVVEVKLNWRDGRDQKLLTEYLPIVQYAMQLETVWPVLVTQCLRGYQHPPLLGLKQLERAMTWLPGDPTPVLLLP
jgi:hypothetical protein